MADTDKWNEAAKYASMMNMAGYCCLYHVHWPSMVGAASVPLRCFAQKA